MTNYFATFCDTDISQCAARTHFRCGRIFTKYFIAYAHSMHHVSFHPRNEPKHNDAWTTDTNILKQSVEKVNVHRLELISKINNTTTTRAEWKNHNNWAG